MSKQIIAKTIGYGIAFVAAGSSYSHQVHLLQRNHVGDLFGVIPSAWVVPATVDGLAIIGLMVRTDPDASVAAKRGALLPLILAGALSVAANVAEATNPVQFIVGIWTVLAYLMAEGLAGKIHGKATTAPASVPVSAPIASPVVVATPAPAIAPAAILRRPLVAVPATAKLLPIVSARRPHRTSRTTKRPAIAATARRTTVNASVPVMNPNTGQPYSERHSRRLRNSVTV